MSSLTIEAMVHDLLGGAPYVRTDSKRARMYESDMLRIVLGASGLSGNVVIDKKHKTVYRTVSIAHKCMLGDSART